MGAYDQEIRAAEQALSNKGMEALVQAEEERLVDRQKKKEEKKQKIEEAKAKALK